MSQICSQFRHVSCSITQTSTLVKTVSIVLFCLTARQRYPGPYILRWHPHSCSTNVTNTERTTTVQVQLLGFTCLCFYAIVYRCLVSLCHCHCLFLCMCVKDGSDFISITRICQECLCVTLSLCHQLCLTSLLQYHNPVKPWL